MVMAPGLGKTVVSSFLTKSIYQTKKKILFLCHDNYILEQAHREFRESFDPQGKLKFYDFYGQLKCVKQAKEADVVFASFQSLNSKAKWYKHFKPKHFAFIIVDEGHHAQAPSFREVIEYFKHEKTLCMTGTPDRADELDIRDLYGEEVVNLTIEEGIASGWLTDVEYHVLSDGLDKKALERLFKEVVTEKRKISLAQINKRLFVKKRDEEQIRIIKKHTKNWQKKCIIFCENIHHVRTFAKGLEKGAYVTFHSENSTKTNTRHLNEFKNTDVNVILSVDKFNEGIDIPDVEVIVFLRATDSNTVYRQQLGRGLRKKPGKHKVVVLDFVANIRRILMIQGMIKTIQYYTGPVRADKSLLSVTGSHYSFDFTDELEQITEILKVAKLGFYPTWQECAQAAIALGFKGQVEYRKRHKEDRQLPSAPEQVYEDFPGWTVFFGGVAKDFYPTWEDAGEAAKKVGITGYSEYQKWYKRDPKLCSVPHKYYANFPGWEIFLGNPVKFFYPTWKSASQAARKLGITSARQYWEMYKQDAQLPSNPHNTYSDWPGWDKFFRRKAKEAKYKTWQQASRAAKRLGIKTSVEYLKKCKKDPKLPKDLYFTYTDFPGFPVFFGRERKVYYNTWQLASRATKALGIKSPKEYNRLYKKDPRLPSTPHQQYIAFPGWKKFIGSTKPKRYKTWQEAGRAAKKLGITNSTEYRQKWRKDVRLPGDPYMFYKGWPGWNKFLSKK